MTDTRATVRQFLRMYWPIALVVVIGASQIIRYAQSRQLADLTAPQDTELRIAQQYLVREMAHQTVTLESLAGGEAAVQQVLDGGPAADPAPIENAIHTLLSRNPIVTQGRWIGEDGRERVRIQRAADGSVSVVPASQLQDKLDRYYVQEGLKLAPDAIYISPIDLNVESGRVETPYHPTIRLVMRAARRDGQPAGIFVLNLSADQMLATFASLFSTGQPTLLNRAGYWLESPDAADEWGFVFDRPETFATRHPALWAAMQAESGRLETDDGLWAWRHVDIVLPNRQMATAAGWIAVSHIPQATVAARTDPVWILTGAATLLALLVLGLTRWRLASEITARRAADKALERERDQLAERNLQLSTSTIAHKRTLAELERSTHDMDEFIYAAARELRAPLSEIQDDAARVEHDYRTCLSGSGVDRAARIRAAIERQDHMFERLLSYSRIGNRAIAQESTDLNELLDEVVDELGAVLAPAEVELRRPRPLPAVRCNPELVKQLFASLIVNGLRFNTSALKWVEIDCDDSTRPPRVTITDNGIGIAPEHQESAFWIFRKVHPPGRFDEGVGSGLTIARKIVEHHGGRIWLESAPGAGTTVVFTLEAGDT